MAASMLHAVVQANLVHEFKKSEKYRPCIELSILIEENEHKPGISIYPCVEIDKWHDIIKMTELPAAAIEIVSPTQSVQDVVNKIEIYLNTGIRSCWLVQPYPTYVTIFNENRQEKTFADGSVTDDHLSISIPITAILS